MNDPRTGTHRHDEPPRLAWSMIWTMFVLLAALVLGLLFLRADARAAGPAPSNDPASSGYDVPVRWYLIVCLPAGDRRGEGCAERWSYTNATACALDAAPDTWPSGTRLRCERRVRSAAGWRTR